MNAKLMTAMMTTMVLFMASGPGMGQTQSSTPAVRNAPRAGGWPAPGASSYTEGQAQARFEAHSFENVAELRKDDLGIWRGYAWKQGIRYPVALDFRGDVFSGLAATADVTGSRNANSGLGPRTELKPY